MIDFSISNGDGNTLFTKSKRRNLSSHITLPVSKEMMTLLHSKEVFLKRIINSVLVIDVENLGISVNLLGETKW